MGALSLKKRNWKSRKIDYGKWILKYDMKFGNVWEFEHPTDEEDYLIFECCKAIDKRENHLMNYVLYNDNDDIFRWFTPPGEENHIPEWWNWLSTFKKETAQPPADQDANIEALQVNCRHGGGGIGKLYAAIPSAPNPNRK